MKTIWKFPLEGPQSRIQIPAHAQILTVQMQYDRPTLWALVDDDNPIVERLFVAIGTGHKLPEWISSDHFVGTVQMENGLVWHIFEVQQWR